MSGTISGNGDDLVQYYFQRIKQVTQKNPNKSLATSTVGSLSESTVNNGQSFNSKGQIANGTLTTHQFYTNNSNQDHRIQAEQPPSTQHLMEGSSTYAGETDSSVFKRPLPVKRFNYKPHIERKIDLMMDSLRSTISLLLPEDKPTFKFMMTTIETLIHTIRNPPVQPVNPEHLIDFVANLVKEEYLSKRVQKSICGSSVMSDQASNIDQYAGSSEKSIRLGKPSGTVPVSVSDSRNILENTTQLSMHRAQWNRPSRGLNSSEYSSTGRMAPQGLNINNSEYSSIGRMAPQGLNINNSEYSSIGRTGLLSYHQETSTRSEAARKMGRLSSGQRLLDTLTEGTLTGSAFDLFNDTEIAQRRDEAAASQEKSHTVTVVPKKSGKTLAKSTPNPTSNTSKVSRVMKPYAAANKKPANSNGRSKVSVPVSENCPLDHSTKNISLLNGTANGISRSGRTLRCPIKYWNSKGEELSCGDIDESVLNESMTLRNKKVLDKKRTPPVRGSKTNTPVLSNITENEVLKPSITKKPRGRPPLTGKENMVAESKKSVKKPTDTPMVKSASSKGKTNKKKEEVSNQNTEKAVKKSAPKRKLKESNHMISKKKKFEDPVASDVEEDDIFGMATYRKPTHQNPYVALSPSAALLSAKKAAGEAQGKATPPCKAIGDMMADESLHSTRSAAKEAPKPSCLESRFHKMPSTGKSKREMLNEAIKRIIKKMEKDQTKAPTQSKAKTQVIKTRKDNSQLNDLMEAAKSTFSVENPVCSATLTVFRGNEQESDLSDMEQDDDDDDLI